MKRIGTLVVSIALIAPATALAQEGSTCQAYNPQTCNVSLSTQPSNTPGLGALPFTGLDIVLLTIGSGTLMATGLVIRRLTRSQDPTTDPVHESARDLHPQLSGQPAEGLERPPGR